jgi:flagellar hook-associated protein 3 FlgL
MRITQQMMSQTALSGMQTNLQRLAEAQKKSVSSKRISLPEDDPFATEQALGYRSNIKEGEYNVDNIDLSLDWVTTTDGALSDTTTLLTRASALALRGGTESLGDDDRKSVASEINGIIEQMVSVANTRNGQYYIFSGFQVNTAPYTVTRDPVTNEITGASYEGDSGSILRQVDGNTTIDINIPGDSLFTNIFTELVNLRESLTTVPFDPDAVSTSMENINNQSDVAIEKQAIIGSKASRLETTKSRLESTIINLRSLDSKAEDADMAEVVTQLQQQQFVYQTALQVNAQITRLSLLDYL